MLKYKVRIVANRLLLDPGFGQNQFDLTTTFLVEVIFPIFHRTDACLTTSFTLPVAEKLALAIVIPGG